jgi:hypothetical protein
LRAILRTKGEEIGEVGSRPTYKAPYPKKGMVLSFGS